MNGPAAAALETVAYGASSVELETASDHRSWRVVVDLTDVVVQLAKGQVLTGIPRVVLEFAKAAPAVARREEILLHFGYFDQAVGKFIELRMEEEPAETAPSGNRLQWLLDAADAFSKNAAVNLPKIRAKYADRPIKRHLQLAKGTLRLAGYRLIHKIKSELETGTRYKPLEFRPNDILLMLGSGWHTLPLFDYVTPLVERGVVRPVILVHDLIPLLDIGEDPPVPPSVFQTWLDSAASLTQDFITYSTNTRNDLLHHFESAGLPPPHIGIIPLAHELTCDQHTPPSQAVRDLIESKYALFVGPAFGRKNAKRLFEAWRKVLSHLGPDATPLLVVTDRTGAEKIEATHIKPIESHVRLLNHPSDFELALLYRHAAFTVFPSLYEGWGLPVGESLWNGTPCVTSNVSALPEVGGPLCDYVDPYWVDSIASAVERLAGDEDYRDWRAEAIRQATFRTWSDFSEGILDTVAAYAQKHARNAGIESVV